MLRIEGMLINDKRVYRLWKHEDLSLPRRRKRRRLGKRTLAPRTIVAKQANEVWSYDIIHDRLENGRMVYCLCVIDEYTRESLAIRVEPSIRARTVIETLEQLIHCYGSPRYLRSDNGAQFTARAVMIWLRRFHIKTAFIEPGKPGQNGFVESFHARLRDECLNMHIFSNGKEAQTLIEQWRQYYNTQRPHSSLNYQTPVSLRDKTLNKAQTMTLNVA
jgi:transposase InsO family protein